MYVIFFFWKKSKRNLFFVFQCTIDWLGCVEKYKAGELPDGVITRG